MEEMTSKERLVNALAGKPVDRVPFSPFLAYVWQHYPKPIFYTCPAKSGVFVA